MVVPIPDRRSAIGAPSAPQTDRNFNFYRPLELMVGQGDRVQGNTAASLPDTQFEKFEARRRFRPLDDSALMERAMMESAIQMDLITPAQAEVLIEKGKTLGEWMVDQDRGEMGELKTSKQKMMDRLGLLALLVFNVGVFVGLGWIVLWVVRSL